MFNDKEEDKLVFMSMMMNAKNNIHIFYFFYFISKLHQPQYYLYFYSHQYSYSNYYLTFNYSSFIIHIQVRLQRHNYYNLHLIRYLFHLQ